MILEYESGLGKVVRFRCEVNFVHRDYDKFVVWLLLFSSAVLANC